MKTLLSLFKIFHFCLGLSLLNACNVINPKEQIPTYIQIDSVSVQPSTPSIHGSTSYKIPTVWVYYNAELLGAFDVPAKIPVLATDKGQLQLIAGIWDNGISSTIAKYPFFFVDTFSFIANPTNTINYKPVFKYRISDTPAIQYFIENFEQGNSFIKKEGDTTFTKTNVIAEVFEEDWSSKVTLYDSINSFESTTIQEFLLPPNRDCYMELNYKTDIPFLVKIEIDKNNTKIISDLIGLKSNSNWTKIYINLKGIATSFANAKFKIILKGDLPQNKTTSVTLIDNFKIIYYN